MNHVFYNSNNLTTEYIIESCSTLLYHSSSPIDRSFSNKIRTLIQFSRVIKKTKEIFGRVERYWTANCSIVQR